MGEAVSPMPVRAIRYLLASIILGARSIAIFDTAKQS
jgi:hypothetical protein